MSGNTRKPPRKSRSLEERLKARLTPNDATGCLEFSGSRDRKGYGRIARGGAEGEYKSRETILTHRAAWELARGRIPDGLCVLHRCDNPSCCNVSHLFLGTIADNNADMVRKGRAVGNRNKGDAHHRTKATSDVRAVILSHSGSSREVAKAVGLSHHTVLRVRRSSKLESKDT